MAAFPYLPLFTDAWVADTHHLSRLARGTYHDLLVLIWRSPGCRVPNDPAWLGPRLGMTPVEIEFELRPIILEFCQSDGNWLTQKRLTKEFTHCNNKRRAQSASAKARWENNKKSNSADRPANAPTTTVVSKKERKKDLPPAPAEPSEANLAYAKSKGLSEQRARSEFDRFRDHAIAKGSKYKNWDAAWRNWVTSPYQANGPSTPREGDTVPGRGLFADGRWWPSGIRGVL